MSVAAGLMSVRAVEDRRDGFSGEQPLPSSVGEEVVSCVHPGDLRGPVFVQHDLNGLVSIQWDLCGPVSIQHDRFGSVSVQWGLFGPLSVQHGLFGPVSIQRGLDGCVYVRWDLFGRVVPCPSRVAREPHGRARVGAVAGAASPLPLLLLPWGPADVSPDLTSEKPSWLFLPLSVSAGRA